MILYPAIDIRGGHAVRLVQGDYERETAFDADPLDAAMRWVEQGARALHVVDLDGARAGRPENLEHIGRICAAAGVPVQVGGGLRDAEAVEAVLEAGAEHVVLGTVAQRHPELAVELIQRLEERIVIAVDARHGEIAVEGWRKATNSSPKDLVGELGERGARRFLYTPVEVDGTLQGPALEGLRELGSAAAEVSADLIYSGGVGSLDHLRQLAALGLVSLAGVVVGRALYEDSFTVSQGQTALEGPRLGAAGT